MDRIGIDISLSEKTINDMVNAYDEWKLLKSDKEYFKCKFIKALCLKMLIVDDPCKLLKMISEHIKTSKIKEFENLINGFKQISELLFI